MRVPAERKGRVVLAEGGLSRLRVNLLFGRQEAGQAVGQLASFGVLAYAIGKLTLTGL